MSCDMNKNQENYNCMECISVENTESKNQVVEYPKLSEEEIERIISERYSYKDEKTKNFIRKALRKHGDRYDYLEVNYINNSTKVEIICSKHGNFYQTPQAHLNGRGCRICGIKNAHNLQRNTSEKFIKKAKKIHVNKYDYSKVNYIDAHTKVCIICPKHGEFWQTPNNHLCRKGCPKCGDERTNEYHKLNKESFIIKSKNIHGDKYNYDKVEYKNEHTKVCIICPKHGEFWQLPMNHLKGFGCFKCTSSKGEDVIRNFLIKNQIKFEEQKRFKFCKDKYPLPFDFYISSKNLCIEFDGIQHFKPIDFSGKLNEFQIKENLKSCQIHDEIKNEYCKNNNINLLRIRYNEDIEKTLTEYFQNNKIIKK